MSTTIHNEKSDPKTAAYLYKLKEKNHRDGTRFELTGPYMSALSLARHRCMLCGYGWDTKPNNVLCSRMSCPACSSGPTHNKKIAKGRRQFAIYTEKLESIVARSSSLRVNQFTFTEHTDAKIRKKTQTSFSYTLRVSCTKCGHKWCPSVQNFFGGHTRCPACSGHGSNLRKFDTQSFRSALLKVQPNLDVSRTTYSGANTKALFTCPTHGLQRRSIGILSSVIQRNGKFVCGVCAEEARSAAAIPKFDVNRFRHLLQERYPNLSFCSKTEYTGMHSPVVLRCEKHGVVTKKKAQWFVVSGCPRCSTAVSRPHSLITDYLTTLGVNFVVNDRSVIRPMELDVYVPTLKLAIEINGRYWHADRPTAHKDKLLACRERGVRLIQFWDTEVLQSWSKVKALMDQVLGRSARIGARECEIIEVPNSVAYQFYDRHHFQGRRFQSKSAVNYGLVIGRKLYQMMSFDRPLFSKNHDLELTRLVTRAGYTVIGGTPRLFSHFRKQFYGVRVVSYCDQRLFLGHTYESLGFRRVRWSKPNYCYVNGFEVLSRYACQKHKLETLIENFDPELSEYDNMKQNGYHRVYDCGSTTYDLRIPPQPGAAQIDAGTDL